jgi:Tol biopolymer transport system component
LLALFAGCAVVVASVSAAVGNRSHPAKRIPKARTAGLVQEKEHRTDQVREYLQEHSDPSGRVRPDLWQEGVRAFKRLKVSDWGGPSASTPGTWQQFGPAPFRVDPGPAGHFDETRLFQGVGPNSGEVGDIAISPAGKNDETVYIASNDGGVWKTTNGGGSWTPLTDSMPSNSIAALALDPVAPDIVYAGTGNPDNNGFLKGVGLFRSENGGQTWEQRGASVFTGRAIFRIVSPSPDVVLVATDCGLYRSVDGGTHFGSNAPFFNNGAAVISGSGCTTRPSTDSQFYTSADCTDQTACVTDLKVDTASSDTIYAAVDGQGIYESTDGGQTFPTNLFDNPGAPAAPFTRISFAQSTNPDNKTMYASVAMPPAVGLDYTFKGLYKSVDGGDTWARKSAADALALDPNYESPGNRDWIAFSRWDGAHWQIWTRSSDGHEYKLTDTASSNNLDPAISPSGNYIAFSSNRDGNYELYWMNSDGTSQTRVTNNAGIDEFPSWSANESALAFDTNRNGNYDIYVHLFNSGTDVPVTTNVADDQRPVFSPDGETLAFMTTRDDANPTTCNPCNTNIYTVSLDDLAHPSQVTKNTATDENPSWAPDGTRIAYDSNRSAGNFDIYTANADGSGSVTPIATSTTSSDTFPTWSEDGQYIAFDSNRSGNDDVWSAKSDGSGSATQLTDDPADDVEPNGEPDYYSNPCQCEYDLTLGVDPQDAGVVYLGFQQLSLSTDGGDSFTSQPITKSEVHWDNHAITFSPSTHWGGFPTPVWIGTDGGVATSDDAGSTWANLNEGIATGLFRGIDIGRGSALNNKYSYGGTQDIGTSEHRPNFGLDWHLSIDGDGGRVAVDPTNPLRAYGIDNGGFIATTDGGASWTTPGANGSAFTYAIDPNYTKVVYRGTAQSGGFKPASVLQRSLSYGSANSWVTMHTFASPVWSIAVSKTNSKILWASLANGTIARTGNADAGPAAIWAFSNVPVAATGRASSIAVDPTDANTAVVVYKGFCAATCPAGTITKHVFRTTNAGGSWQDISGTNGGAQNFPDLPANSVTIDPTTSPHTIIVGTDAGVVSSQDNGKTWQVLGTGLPVAEVSSVQLDPTANPPLLRVGTYGRSVWELMRAPATVPGAPSNVSATAGNASAALRWSAPSLNGGRAISGYVVTPYVGGVAQPSRAVGTATSATVTGLTNGRLYTFRVSAMNAIGTGPPSAASNGVTPAGAPGAPQSVVATGGDRRARVRWTAPASNGGSGITGYTVTPHAAGRSFSPIPVGNVGTVVITGLTNGTRYTFTVSASNRIGTGPGTTSNSVVPRPLKQVACIVPKVVGRPLAKAKRLIKAAHCRVGKISYRRSTRAKKGRVLSQKPKPRTHRPVGARVSLVVGR